MKNRYSTQTEEVLTYSTATDPLSVCVLDTWSETMEQCQNTEPLEMISYQILLNTNTYRV